jgi:hypothetical protein
MRTVYVNNSSSNTGANNGSSWQDAFKTLQQALLYCADTIKVAAGTYLPVNSITDSVFNLQNKTVIMGGYPSAGSPTDASRDPDRYQTLLHSNFPSSYYGNSSVLRVFHCDSTTVIDGLTFDNELPGPYVDGLHTSLLIDYGSNPRVTNCRFLTSATVVPGLYNIEIFGHSNPLIQRALFIGRNGVINCKSHSSPAIQYCRNDGTTGIQIIADSCTGRADSCIFSYAILNHSNIQFSNAVFSSSKNTDSSNSSFDNCIFKNGFSPSGPVITNDHSSPVFNKCLFDSCLLVMSNSNQKP